MGRVLAFLRGPAVHDDLIAVLIRRDLAVLIQLIDHDLGSGQLLARHVGLLHLQANSFPKRIREGITIISVAALIYRRRHAQISGDRITLNHYRHRHRLI